MTSSVRRSQQVDRLSIGAILGVIGLIALQILIGLVSYGIVILLSFNSDSCSGSGKCNYAMGAASVYLVPIATTIVAILSIVFTIVLTRNRRSAIASPIIGVALMVVAGIVAIVLNLNAFT